MGSTVVRVGGHREIEGKGAVGLRRGDGSVGNGINGKGSTRSVWVSGSFLSLFLAALASLLLAAGCVSGDEQARQASPTPPNKTSVGGSTAEDDAQASSLEGETFTLAPSLPVPPRFEAAYQREVPIVVEFFQQGQDPYYPQGLEVDEMVNNDLMALRDDYPGAEFFTYDIDNPGNAETSEDLEPGEYGTLAAQLDVGYTPFVAMLAPRENGYVVEEVFQGYVDREILDQALYELTNRGISDPRVRPSGS